MIWKFLLLFNLYLDLHEQLNKVIAGSQCNNFDGKDKFGQYFGPYLGVLILHYILKQLLQIYPYPCNAYSLFYSEGQHLSSISTCLKLAK